MRRARKAHQCYECGAAIPAGVSYQFVSTLYDGHWDSYRTCLACVEIHRAMSACDRDGGAAGFRCLGILWEDIREYVFPDLTTGCLARCATVAAKQKLSERWLAWKHLNA